MKKIKQMSVRDPLTSCYNKRYLKQYLPVEISRPKRYRRTMSMAMCDIDHFKTVNHTHGHQAGDVVLKNFSFCLKQAARKNHFADQNRMAETGSPLMSISRGIESESH